MSDYEKVDFELRRLFELPEEITFPQPTPRNREFEQQLAKARAPDPLDQFFENLKSEAAGVPRELLTDPVLPDPRARLRSEHNYDYGYDDEGERLEKFAASTAAGRRKQAISEYLARRKASGASFASIVRELTEKCERLDPELVAMLKGENA